MPGQFLSEADRINLNRFPLDFSVEELDHYYQLSEADLVEIHKQRGAVNQLGFAVQLGTLRHLGFCPDEVNQAPVKVVSYIALQLRVKPAVLSEYGSREHTRTDHLNKIQTLLGYKGVKAEENRKLEEWLLERALEHDEPTVLLRQLMVRPGITVLERMVSHAREQARTRTFEQLSPLLTPQRRKFLDELLLKNDKLKATRFEWLRQEATKDVPKAINLNISKVKYLQEQQVAEWPMAVINPNRRKFLATLCRKTSAEALDCMNETRKYPLLLCFVYSALAELSDQTFDLFDSYLAGAYSRAGNELEEFRRKSVPATNEKLHFFGQLGRVILNSEVKDEEVRQTIFAFLPQEQLELAVEESDRLVRPLDDTYFDYLAKSYPTIRQFAPKLLEAFVFHSNTAAKPLLDGIMLLKRLNQQNRKGVPRNAPQAFISHKWHPYVFEDSNSEKPTGRPKKRGKRLNRRYYELCILWELRQSLRSGDIWVAGRNHARSGQ
ncbi:DUF4158 domain-containing protein [Candidatus Chlorohelix sp.]|uniref:DUF4158 domain-containing protein n=1 Tax=Candidatus Chlorohelix sp. TaxID=3139201 RepID=UPI00306D056F